MADHTHFSFHVEGLDVDAPWVAALDGREALSEPFAFRVELVLETPPPQAPGELLGRAACLTLTRPGGTERHVHGELGALECVGSEGGPARYVALLVPRLRRLGLTRRSRVFQGLSVPEVVGQVLDGLQVPYRLELSGSYPAQPLCMQYRESDLAFVTRLLEREGIFYAFVHAPDGHTLVLLDDPERCGPIPGSPQVPLRERAARTDTAGDEHVSHVAQTLRVRPGRVVLRDFDFERPGAELSATQEVGEAGGAPLEHSDAPGGFRQQQEGRQRARVRLEELRVDAEAVRGQGTCTRLVPGATFELTEHAHADLQEPLLVLEVEHSARQHVGAHADRGEAFYRNGFRAARASAPFRPQRRCAPPVASAETATVVGPPGEPVHVDPHGRIKVQFHWDRDGRGDDRSLCWVRLAQGWAGAGMGASFVPRVGQEVVLRFLEGDPDQPVVVGALYNGQNVPPLALPDQKTASTWRSASSPGEGGFNELRFEDAAGAEEVYLHAQRDQRVQVRHDALEEVEGQERQRVGRDRSLQVHAAQHVLVGGDVLRTVQGEQAVRIDGGRTLQVADGAQLEVAQGRTVRVGGAHHLAVQEVGTEHVGGEASVKVAGAGELRVAGALTATVSGARSLKVAGASAVSVGGGVDEQVGEARVLKVGKDAALVVEGGLEHSVGKDRQEQVGGGWGLESTGPAQWMMDTLELQADAFKLVVGGKVALELTRSGNVTWAGSSLTLEGRKLTLKGSKVKKLGKDSAPSASPKVDRLESKSESRASIDLALTDQDGRPIANERFRVELPDGSVVTGRLDGQGKARVPSGKPGSCKVSFPDLDGGAWKS